MLWVKLQLGYAASSQLPAHLNTYCPGEVDKLYDQIK
jgi:hypothetical protein